MKSVVIFSKAGCTYCATLAREYGLIQSDLSKQGIQLIIWSQEANGDSNLKHPKGRRAGPPLSAMGIIGQLPMPAIFLLDTKQWDPTSAAADHAFLRDVIALFDGAIVTGFDGGISLKHYGRMPRNHANIMSWVKSDHSLPPPTVRPSVEAAPVHQGQATCSRRFVSAASTSNRRR